MKKEPYKILSITESLERDLTAGLITLEEAAAELYKANLTFYVDINRAKELLKGDAKQ